MPHVTVPACGHTAGAEHPHSHDLVDRVRDTIQRELRHGLARLHGQHGDRLAIEHAHCSVGGAASSPDSVDGAAVAAWATVSGSAG